MEAGIFLRRFLIGFVATVMVGLIVDPAAAADRRTRNFIVQAPTAQLAAAVADAAERYRHDLAMHWLGAPLDPWPTPCPIRVIAGPHLAAQGATTYNPRPVSDFQMEVIGTPERILDSVLPHEVTHTILATHFGRPLPRWADEGICTTVEHSAERNKHEIKLREFLRSRRGIAMNQLFLMTEYPSDVLPMYAQGYSVCRFLIDQKGPRAFIQFLHDYMQHPSWTANIKKHYDYDSLKELQEYWLVWVSEGSASVDKFVKVQPEAVPSQSLASQVIPAAATAEQLARSEPSQSSLSLNGPAQSIPAGQPSAATTRAAAEDLPATRLAAIGGPATHATAISAIGKPNGIALASANAEGWYQRKKMDAQASRLAQAGQLEPEGLGKGASRAAAIGPIAPPSVVNSGPYQSAHPQQPQGISRTAAPLIRPLVSGNPGSGHRYR